MGAALIKQGKTLVNRGVQHSRRMDEWFDSIAEEQYTKALLFLTAFSLMSTVVRGSYHSCSLPGFKKGHQHFNHINL